MVQWAVNNETPTENYRKMNMETATQEPPITISIFKHQADNNPEMVDVTFPELCLMTEEHDIRAKKDGLAFSGAQYSAGQTRANANVIQLNLIIIDVDGGDKDAVLLKCAQQGWRGLAYSTFSNGKKTDGDRFRIVLVPSRPILPAELAHIWTATTFWLGADGSDTTTIDVSRLYFTPSCPAAYKDQAFSVVLTGDTPVDVDAMLQMPAPAAAAKNKPSKGSMEEKLSLREIAEEVRASLYHHDLWYHNEAFRFYELGYWRRIDERVDLMKNILNHYDRLTADGVCEVTNTLRLLCAEHVNSTDESIGPLDDEHGLICVSNGALNPVTGELQPHARFPRLLSALTTPWLPNAEAPRFINFLNEIWGDERDFKERVNFLQEFLGYILYPSNKFERFLWLTGQGSNGKSVLLQVMANLAGSDNTSWVHLDRLNSNAVRANLEGKSLNISAEMNSDGTLADGHLKSITSGEPVDAEAKYKMPYVFKPKVKLVAATNQLPRLKDTSGGFARRAVIISFNRIFSLAERDANLGLALAAEQPGILAFAVEGLTRLLKRGHFVPPPSSEEILQAYRTESCSVAMFNRDAMEPSEEGTAVGLLYEKYREFCATNGFSPTNVSIFGRRLTELGVTTLRKSTGRPIRAAKLRVNFEADDPCKIASANIVDFKRPGTKVSADELFGDLDALVPKANAPSRTTFD